MAAGYITGQCECKRKAEKGKWDSVQTLEKSRNPLGFGDHLDQTHQKQGSHCLLGKAGAPSVLFTDLSSALRLCPSHSSCSINMCQVNK